MKENIQNKFKKIHFTFIIKFPACAWVGVFANDHTQAVWQRVRAACVPKTLSAEDMARAHLR